LARLEQLALAHGRHELAIRFAEAHVRETNEPAQTVWSHAVQELVRNQDICLGWPAIAEAIAKELETLIALVRGRREGPLPLRDYDISYLESLLVEVRCNLARRAEKELERLADERLREGPELTWEQASAAVIEERPELYSQYEKERAETGTRNLRKE
jgi:hypothetical protein